MHHLRPALSFRQSARPKAALIAALSTAQIFLAAAGQGAEAESPHESPQALALEAQPADALQLATTLQAVGRLDACTVEALRHAYLHPEAAAAGVDLAARCLVQAGQWSQSRQLLWHPLHRPAVSASRPLRWRACLIDAVAADGQPAQPACQDASADPRLALLPAARALVAGEWSAARSALAGPALALSADVSETADLRSDLQAWEASAVALPAPSPWVAAALSTAVPGLGRVYLGRWQEGLTSLLLVGAPAWFAYGGFERDGVDSVRGWLLATTSAVFYLGNVYGSWVGAEVDRRKADQRLRQEIRSGLGRWIER